MFACEEYALLSLKVCCSVMQCVVVRCIVGVCYPRDTFSEVYSCVCVYKFMYITIHIHIYMYTKFLCPHHFTHVYAPSVRWVLECCKQCMYVCVYIYINAYTFISMYT